MRHCWLGPAAAESAHPHPHVGPPRDWANMPIHAVPGCCACVGVLCVCGGTSIAENSLRKLGSVLSLASPCTRRTCQPDVGGPAECGGCSSDATWSMPHGHMEHATWPHGACDMAIWSMRYGHMEHAIWPYGERGDAARLQGHDLGLNRAREVC